MAARGALLVTVLAILLAGVPAAAQPDVPPAPPADLGAPPATDDPRRLRVRGSLRLQGEYTDNVFLSERDRRDEFRESLTPTLALRYFTRDLSMSATYAPSLVHSSVSDDDALVFHDFAGDVRWALTERLALTVDDRFVRTDDPAVSDPRNAFRGRATVTQNALGSALSYRQEPWTATARYGLTLNRTEREGQSDAPDERSTVHVLGGDVTLDVLQRTTVAAGYDLTLGAFDVGGDVVGHRGRLGLSRALDPVTTADVRASLAHRDVDGGADFDIYRVDVGVRRELGPRYTAEARVGYAVFDPERGRREELPEVLLQGTYTGRAVRLTVRGVQAFQETFLEPQNTGVTRTREATIEVRWDLGARVTLTLDGRVADNRFLQSALVPGVTTGSREDTLLGGGLEVGVRLSRTLLLTLGYDHASVTSSVPGFDYQRNRVRLGITFVQD